MRVANVGHALALAGLVSCAVSPRIPLAATAAALAEQTRPAALPKDLRLRRVSRDGSLGEPFALASQLANVTIVELWATWCGPCREALPATVALTHTFAATELGLVAVSVDDDTTAIPPYLAQLGLELQSYAPESAAVLLRSLEVRELPTTLVIDGRGRIIGRYAGVRGGQTASLRRQLCALLGCRE